MGRFTGVDPIAEEFPHLSVYNYASNEPVNNIDLHGLQAGGNMYQQMEKTERIAKDALTIAGGALLIVGTGGSASPLVVAGGTIGGTYGMASGTAQLITDATGDFAKSDAVSETAAGFLAQPIDQALGGENRLAEKSADFAQNLFVAIYPKSVSEGVLNVEQVADAGVSLFGEAAKVMGSSSPTKKADKTSAHKTPFNDTTIKLASPDLLKNRRSTLSQSGQLSPKQVEDISNFLKGGY